ncbi:glycosyltransferase family 4 protein [Pseudomonas phoenicis]|uniref:glycosyltransferase family 4 protein n=1 Tax=unclassified Pseudomonas TaxID=196821 RepID=UPI0039A302F1
MKTPPLHIALVSDTFAPEINGVANALAHLSEGLRQRGHRVDIVRARLPADVAGQEGVDLSPVTGWPWSGFAGLRWSRVSMHKLWRRWRGQRPDVLYIATQGPLGVNALRAARRLGIAVVSGFHTDFAQCAGRYGSGLLARALTCYLRGFHRRTALTLVPSLSQRLELQRRGFERVELLAHGVDAHLFNPARRSRSLREHWGLGPEDLAVLHVGRLAAQHNLDLLGPCLAALQRASPQRRLRLIVVGEGPQRDVLAQRWPDAVFCGGQRGEALAEHYASSDLCLFPSLIDTLGSVVLEAMASGLVVVAFDQAAAAQHIRHGYNGALAMPGDSAGFIEAACWLFEDHESVRRVRLNARHHALQQGWPGVVERFEEYLVQACLAHGAQGALDRAYP